MKRYLVRRVLQMVPTLLVIIIATFALVHASPGDPAYTLAGEEADQETLAKVRAEYGLDDPLPQQLGGYVWRVLHGDLGRSYSYGQPVTEVIWRALPTTILLTGTALLISTIVGIWLGVVATRKPDGILDHSIGAITLGLFAIPAFWLAQVAIILLVLRWGIFPVGGYAKGGPGAPTGLGHLADVTYHLLLPATVLAASEVAAVTRLTRSAMLSQLGLSYTRAAEAKGLRRDRVLSHHVLRNALLPVITLVGARIGFLFSGAVVIESLFAWPGIGGVLRAAATTLKDPPLVVGIVLMTSFAVVIANVVTDLVYTWVDPRVRLD